MGNPYDPYGQQPGYGQQQPGYGQQPPAQPGYGAPAAPAQPGYQEIHHHHYGSTGQLAEWGSRAGGYIIDYLIFAGPVFVLYLLSLLLTSSGSGGAAVLGLLFMLVGFALSIAGGLWICYQEGTTGQSIGKRQMGIRLISAQTGQPIGFGMAFVRKLAHIADSFLCYIGFLWPLWDDRKQTFADKICNTIVVRA